MKNNNVQQWLKEIREVATEARNGGDVKSLNCFLSAAGKNLAYLRFEAMANKATKKTKTIKK